MRNFPKQKAIAAALSLWTAAHAPFVFADPAANALPTNGRIVAGAGSISQSGNAMTVQQNTARMIANWDTFDIGSQASVTFNQPNAASVALNRVQTMGASQIFGKLSANGQVFIINPSGVLFGSTARIDTGALVASTLALSDANFLAGNYRFENAGGTGSIVNQGSINARTVAFISPAIRNEGTISTPGGTTALLAGDAVSLDFDGDRLINFTVDKGAVAALIENKGAISVGDGVVALTAKGVDAVSRAVVNDSGVIRANGVSTQGGRILLTGDEVTVEGTAVLDASGKTGGGTILVGGSWQNSDPAIYQASQTVIKRGAVLDAGATDGGQGGTIVAWSKLDGGATFVQGSLKADGGRIETSGGYLNVTGIDVSAKGGQWLLDPNNITIDSTGPTTAGAGALPNYTSNADSSIVWNTDIQSALNLGTNVTIQTGTGGANSQAGDITVAADIAKTGGGDAALTLNAYGHIYSTNHSITSSAGKLNVALNANLGGLGDGVNIQYNTITTNGGNFSAVGNGVNYYGVQIGYSTITTGGGSFTATGTGNPVGSNHPVYIEASAISTGGGNVTLTGTTGGNSAGVIVRTSSITTGSGNITLTGNSAGGWGAIELDGATLKTTAGGSIELTGTATATDSGVKGIDIYNNSTIIASGAGTVTLEGTGYDAPGIAMDGSSTITAGTGAVSLTGKQDAASSGGIGIYSLGTIQTSGGDVYLEGHGGAAGGVGIWLGLYSVGDSVIDAGGGNITLKGYGADAYGVYMESNSADQATRLVTSGNGAISITGTVTGSASSPTTATGVMFGEEDTVNTGVLIQTGNGDITIVGTAGVFSPHDVTNDGSTTAGVNFQRSTVQTTGNGNIAITGTGATSTYAVDGGDRDGVNIENHSTIQTGSGAGGTGKITITGTGHGAGEGIDMQDTPDNSVIAGSGGVVMTGSNTNGGTDGLQLRGVINAIGGSIQLTGTGGDNSSVAGGGGQGVQIDTLTLGSGDTTSITVKGTANSGDQDGILIWSPSSTVTTSAAGAISMIGYGSGSAYGIDTAYVTMTAGTGGISLNGTGRGGLGISNTNLQATNGNITLTGTGADGSGVYVNNTSIATLTGGNIRIDGTATSGPGTQLAGTPPGVTSVSAAGAGTIDVTGTTAGNTANQRGIDLYYVNISSVSGAISLTGKTGGSSSYGVENWGSSTVSSSSGGNITIKADSVKLEGPSSTYSSTGILKILPYTASTPIELGGAGGTSNLGITQAAANTFTDGFSYIQIGDTTNTGGIAVSGAFTVKDSLRLAQGSGNIAVNNALTLSTAGDYLQMSTTGSATEGASGAITASKLELLGAGGSYVLDKATGTTGNNVATLAANTGSVNYADRDALDINAVDSTSGITTTGTIKVVTKSAIDAADLTISQNIATSDASASAIFLNAGEEEAAPQTTLVGSRADIVYASGAITTGAGGRATLMTGSIAGSAALAAQVGFGSGRFRYGSDETTISYSGALGAGTYLVYREQPAITAKPADYVSIYGDTPNPTQYAPTAGDLRNGDALGDITFSGGTIVSTGSATSNTGIYDLTSTATPMSSLGYRVTIVDNHGGHTINKRPLTITANDDGKTYDGLAYSGGNGVTGDNWVNGDDINDLGGALTYGGDSQGAVLTGRFSITPGGFTSGNYDIRYVDGTLTITSPYSDGGAGTLTPPTPTPPPPPPPPPVIVPPSPTPTPTPAPTPSTPDTPSTSGVNGGYQFGGLNVGDALSNGMEFPLTAVQVVVYRPGAAPVAENGFTVSVSGSGIRLEARQEVDQGFAAPGKLLETLPFVVQTDTGELLEFTAKVTEKGLLIQPQSRDAAEYSEGRRDAVIGEALSCLKQNLNFNVRKIRTVYLSPL